MDSKIKKSPGIDMLHGALFRKIIVFAMPLLASGILQQSFNAVDVSIVGRFASSQAMAAVGSNGSLISIMVSLFLGISIGANIVIANYIGQHNTAGIKRAVSTVSFVAVASGIILLLIGELFAKPILELMSVPEDVIDLATVYLKVYFFGMPFMMIYNFASAIMRSMGDTKRPFYSLAIASVLNIILDLVFVMFFDMDVDGVALATVLSNVVNAALMVYWLTREPEPYRLNIKDTTINRNELKKILQIGVPAGIQGMVFSLANIFIQSSINKFGSYAVAGSAAALSYEVYCYYIVSAFCQAAVAFLSQNYGAGQYDRCKRVFWLCLAAAIVGTGAMNVLIVWQKDFCLSVFTSDPEVLHYAIIRLQCVLLFQWIAATYEVSGACMRGLGYSMTPTLITIFGTCVLRLGWVYMAATKSFSFAHLLYIYPISWVFTGAAVMTAYFIVQKKVFSRKVMPI
ncbi:MAG: MATE family efflux transporter [Bacteroides sp.]|nr:MATE family efflux transporter [Bacteroides sp.]MCM1390134.1 MATE family efflux transporter [Bacteroides sp.]